MACQRHKVKPSPLCIEFTGIADSLAYILHDGWYRWSVMTEESHDCWLLHYLYMILMHRIKAGATYWGQRKERVIFATRKNFKPFK